MNPIDRAALESAHSSHPEADLPYYVTFDRFENPKETTKFIRNILETLADPERLYSFADIGCANGEMIYHFRQRFPHWAFHGFDHLEHHIESAKKHPGLAGVASFETKDLFDVQGQFDFVGFFGTITIFWDYEDPINKLLSLCKPGGYVLIDGYFSPDEVETRTFYMDKSHRPGVWVRDWSLFTRSGLREFLAERASSVEFYDIPMIEIPRDPSAIHILARTTKDADGRNRITNGTQRLLDDTLMVVNKL